ncbi:sortase [Streptomyces sp. NPDC002328]|uniref:sortase n=1 Tax=Streptomyces sp. NPDC002328 TaxID=3364642 RepID=UPI0036A38DB3
MTLPAPPPAAPPTAAPPTATPPTATPPTAVPPTAASPTAASPKAVPPTAAPPKAVLSPAVPPAAVLPPAVPPAAVPPAAVLPPAVPPAAVLPPAVPPAAVPPAAVPPPAVPPPAVPPPAPPPARPARPLPPERAPRPPARPGLALAGAALCVLAALLLGFAANLTVVGHLEHSRDQQTAYDELRRQLALGIAPVGQRDYEGRLLEPGAPVALLRIPALGLREVVAEGTTSEVLMSGPGHRRDTPLPGQAGTVVLMGRQWAYGSPFNDLHVLPVGSRIELTSGQGKAVYEVTGLRRGGDELPAPLGQGQGRLTLITATGAPYTPHGVLRVDARLLTPVQPHPPRALRAGWIAASEEALGTEDGAWLAVFLWTQGLLLAALLTVLAHRFWGRWQTWICAGPVLLALGLADSRALTALLPNLL